MLNFRIYAIFCCTCCFNVYLCIKESLIKNRNKMKANKVPTETQILALVYLALIIVSLASLIWAAATGQVDLNNW